MELRSAKVIKENDEYILHYYVYDETIDEIVELTKPVYVEGKVDPEVRQILEQAAKLDIARKQEEQAREFATLSDYEAGQELGQTEEELEEMPEVEAEDLEYEQQTEEELDEIEAQKAKNIQTLKNVAKGAAAVGATGLAIAALATMLKSCSLDKNGIVPTTTPTPNPGTTTAISTPTPDETPIPGAHVDFEKTVLTEDDLKKAFEKIENQLVKNNFANPSDANYEHIVNSAKNYYVLVNRQYIPNNVAAIYGQESFEKQVEASLAFINVYYDKNYEMYNGDSKITRLDNSVFFVNEEAQAVVNEMDLWTLAASHVQTYDEAKKILDDFQQYFQNIKAVAGYKDAQVANEAFHTKMLYVIAKHNIANALSSNLALGKVTQKEMNQLYDQMEEIEALVSYGNLADLNKMWTDCQYTSVGSVDKEKGFKM